MYICSYQYIATQCTQYNSYTVYVHSYIVCVWFRNMKVTLKCNRNLANPNFKANGENVQLQYVSHVYIACMHIPYTRKFW